MVVRLLPHSSSDDHRKYRLEKDINSDKNNDPLEKFKHVCIKNNILSKNDFLKLEKIFQMKLMKMRCGLKNKMILKIAH